jgi:outer membrane immunogenic protein
MANLMWLRAICLGLAGSAAVGIARAHDTTPWDGGYFGINAGPISSSTCNSWALNRSLVNSADASQLGGRDCPKANGIIGGLQVGENFQHKRLVWGIDANLEYWGSATRDESFSYVGQGFPPGRYTFSTRESPSEFAIIGPRIGYAANPWLAYLRVGALLSEGAHKSELYYAPIGTTKPTASFTGGRDFSPYGWAAGAGAELGLYGAWSLTLEYLHASLAAAPDSSEGCSGPAAICSAFSGLALGTAHESYGANIVRIGITYWFNYWDP